MPSTDEAPEAPITIHPPATVAEEKSPPETENTPPEFCLQAEKSAARQLIIDVRKLHALRCNFPFDILCAKDQELFRQSNELERLLDKNFTEAFKILALNHKKTSEWMLSVIDFIYKRADGLAKDGSREADKVSIETWFALQGSRSNLELGNIRAQAAQSVFRAFSGNNSEVCHLYNEVRKVTHQFGPLPIATLTEILWPICNALKERERAFDRYLVNLDATKKEAFIQKIAESLTLSEDSSNIELYAQLSILDHLRSYSSHGPHAFNKQKALVEKLVEAREKQPSNQRVTLA